MLTMQQLALVPVFMTVADSQSFSKAAIALDLSNASVGNKIKQLEQSLGIHLFHRTTRSVSLTEQGRQLYDALSPIQQQLKNIDASLQKDSQRLQGTLRISAPPQFGQQHLPKLISQFQQQHPGIQFDIRLSNDNLDLVQQGIDLAIRGIHFDQHSKWDSALYRAKLLFTQPVIAVASPYYLKHSPSLKQPEDLEHHDILLLKRNDGHVIRDWRFQQGNRCYNLRLTPSLTANDLSLLIDACRFDRGIALTPKLAVQQYLKEKQLTRVLSDYTLPDYKLYAVYPRHSNVTHNLRAWLDFLARWCDRP